MFIIDIQHLRFGKNNFHQELTSEDIRWDVDRAQLTSPVRVDLTIRKIEDKLLFSGTCETEANFVCDRCLTETKYTVQKPFELYFRYRDRRNYSKDLELTAKETQECDYSGHEIDFSVYVREVLILTIPIKILCRDDCKGLCSHCGQNLNKGHCSCLTMQTDSRWEQLKALQT